MSQSMQLSSRVQAIPEALTIWMNQIVSDLKRGGRAITVLSSGEAYFDVPWFGIEAEDATAGNHYSDSRGIRLLRDRIADFHEKTQGFRPDPASEVLVTAGSKMAIFLAMLALLNPGDEIAIHEPAWVSYQEQARLVGAVPRFISYDVAVEDVPDHFGPRTRVAIFNNPNNPAGSVYGERALRRLYEECKERGVVLLSDEAYADFIVDEPFVSLGRIAPDLASAFIVNSLSKNLGVAGWRIGYAIARNEIIDACLKLNQHLVTCAPTVLQLYLARNFEALAASTLPQAQTIVRKRARVADAIDLAGLSRLPGSSTFYFFVSIGGYAGSSLDFAIDLLLEDGVSAVPGIAYGASTDRFIRVSIGAENEERIAAALNAIRRRIDTPPASPPTERLRALGFTPFGIQA